MRSPKCFAVPSSSLHSDRRPTIRPGAARCYDAVVLDVGETSNGQSAGDVVCSRNRRCACLRALVFLAAGLAAPSSSAQPLPPAFQLTLSNPGARSVGLGGAFVALADDATAAFSNPAGLDQLTRPEVSAELRLEISSDFSESEDATDLTGLGFFSYVYPARRWSIAAYGNRLASVEFGLEETFRVRNYGVSAAYRLSDPLSLGIGLSYFGGRLGELSSTDWGVTAGLVWRWTELWKVGAFYRQGADLDFDVGTGLPLPLDLPDSGGFGLAFRTPDGKLTAAFEWDRIRYSSLLKSLPDDDLVLEDGDELHLGGEYALLLGKPVVALRAGIWREPDHRIHRTGERSQGIETHRAVGLGLAFRRLQLDLGADFSNLEGALSISAIYGL